MLSSVLLWAMFTREGFFEYCALMCSIHLVMWCLVTFFFFWSFRYNMSSFADDSFRDNSLESMPRCLLMADAQIKRPSQSIPFLTKNVLGKRISLKKTRNDSWRNFDCIYQQCCHLWWIYLCHLGNAHFARRAPVLKHLDVDTSPPTHTGGTD